MNPAACLQTAMDAGELDERVGRLAQERFIELQGRYTDMGMDLAAARRLAAEDMVTAATQSAQRNRHTVIAQLRDMARAQAEFSGVALRDADALLKRLDDVEHQQRALTQRFMAGISDFLKHNRTRITGQLRDKAMVADVARELHGQSTGNVNAREFARAVEAAQDEARQLFNLAGGDIGKLEHRGVRHAHDARRIREAGFDTWFAALWDSNAIDWHRIRNFDTGKPFALEPGRRPPRPVAERFLRDVYEGITTEGWDARLPSTQARGRAMYRRNAEHRVLHFRDGDAWLAYNERFGQANPFDAIVGELRGMARDISLMQAFGPNPRAGIQFRSDIMTKDAMTAGASVTARNYVGQRPLAEVVARKNAKAQVMLDMLTGAANVPVDGMGAAFFAGLRNLLTAAQLGGATLSQVTDIPTMRLAAKSVGLNPTAPWQNALRLMTDNMTQQQARDLGYVFDTWFQAGAAQARMIGDIWSPEWTNRITNFVLRSNGLAYITDRSRTALRYSFSLELGELAQRSFADLPEELRSFMAERQFTRADWDAVRASGALFQLPTGGHAISPRWFVHHTDLPRAQAEDIARRLGGMIEAFTEIGIPSASTRGRATLLGDARPGTVSGELLRSSVMYKSYALSLMFNHMRHTLSMRDVGTAAVYVSALVAQTWALGAVAVQLKELAKGRDPRPMDRPDFWGAAFFQGAGVGIFGDFFTSTTSRAGGGLAETAAGPVVGVMGDLGRAVSSNVARVAEGQETLVGRDAVNLARRYNPLATHWAVRTALDRMVWDQLQDILDPEARTQWRQFENRIQREMGARSFWQRGQMLPGRGPDISNAIGGQQ
jgi:hypothetical protein